MADPSHVNAPSDTLLGKLQRGQGRGYLDALAAPRAEAVSCLLNCLRDDPCWDRQVESRDEQYGELAVALALPVEPLDELLHEGPADGEDEPHYLAIDVLLQMLRRGRADAGEVLREYVAYGTDPSHVLYELHEHRPELLAGLDEVIVSRLDEPGMADRLYAEHEPVRSWCRSHPRLAEALAPSREWRERYDAWRASLPDYTTMPLAEMLATVTRETGVWMRRALSGRVRRADAELLLAALDPEELERSMLALAALREIADSSLLEPLAEFQVRVPERPAGLNHALWRAIGAIDDPRVLELGRQWFHDERWPVMITGRRILEQRATAEDMPVIRELLASDQHADHGTYRICSGLEMATRLTEPDLWPLLADAYHELDYAWGRMRAVEAMVANAPKQFAEQYAFECLWDCEHPTREAGLAHVARTPAALARIRALADDAIYQHAPA